MRPRRHSLLLSSLWLGVETCCGKLLSRADFRIEDTYAASKTDGMDAYNEPRKIATRLSASPCEASRPWQSRGELPENGSKRARRRGSRGAAAGLRNPRGRRVGSNMFQPFSRGASRNSFLCDFLFRVHAMPDVSWPRAALPKGSSGWGVPPSVISAHGIHVPWLEIGFGCQNALRNVMLGS